MPGVTRAALLAALLLLAACGRMGDIERPPAGPDDPGPTGFEENPIYRF